MKSTRRAITPTRWRSKLRWRAFESSSTTVQGYENKDARSTMSVATNMPFRHESVLGYARSPVDQIDVRATTTRPNLRKLARKTSEFAVVFSFASAGDSSSQF